jgi:hypothetical protein
MQLLVVHYARALLQGIAPSPEKGLQKEHPFKGVRISNRPLYNTVASILRKDAGEESSSILTSC